MVFVPPLLRKEEMKWLDARERFLRITGLVEEGKKKKSCFGNYSETIDWLEIDDRYSVKIGVFSLFIDFFLRSSFHYYL